VSDPIIQKMDRTTGAATEGPYTITRTDNPSSLTWSGVIVIGGTVVASGSINGVPSADGKGRINVKNRDWSQKSQDATPEVLAVTDKRFKLPLRPTAFKDQFGLTGSIVEAKKGLAFINALGHIADGGPNNDLAYFADIPVSIDQDVQVNYPALTTTSDFYKIQEDFDRGGFCGKSWVTNLVPMVEQHEGTQAQANSHVRIFFDHAWPMIKGTFESLVMPYADDVISPVVDYHSQRITDEALADSHAMDTDRRNVITTKTLPCDFHYDYGRLPK
jgi:hypothetical protein